MTQGNNQNRLFKPKIYQGEKRGQSGNYYHQDRYQNRNISNSGDRRMSYRGRAQYGQNYSGRSQYDQNYRSYFGIGNFRGTHNYRRQHFRGEYRGNFRNASFRSGRSRSRERQYSGNFRRNEQSSIRSRSCSRVSAYRDQI